MKKQLPIVHIRTLSVLKRKKMETGQDMPRKLRPVNVLASTMTAMNGYATIRRATDEFVEQGSFDPGTMVMAYADEWELPEGKVPMLIRERLFIPPELASMLHHAGFAVEHIWGGTAGEWGERPLKLDEIEVMFTAHKR